MLRLKSKFLLGILVLTIILSSCKKDDLLPVEEVKDSVISYEYKQIISNLYPDNESVNIDVRFQPSIKFNSWSQEYLSKYRISIDYILLEQNGIEIEFEEVWNSKNDSLVIIPNKRFNPNANIKLALKVHWEVLEGLWFTPDSVYSEEKELTFSTKSVSSTEIDANNVEYSYPFPDQYHFLKDEYNKGFIKLIAPQNELFEVDNSSGNVNFIVRITNLDGFIFESAATYKLSMIEFNMPSNIENEEIYKLEIIKIKETQETSIYTSHFRTSMHNTSQEKFKAFDDLRIYFKDFIEPRVQDLGGWYYAPEESFDEYERLNYIGLIRFELDPSTPYYESVVNPLIYKNINKTNLSPFTTERANLYMTEDEIKKYNVDIKKILAYPPLNHITLRQAEAAQTLTEENISSNNAPRIICESNFVVNCSFSRVAYYDYRQFFSWITNNYSQDNIPDWAKITYNNLYQSLPIGDYKIKVKYTLPNGITTYEEELILTCTVGSTIDEIRLD